MVEGMAVCALSEGSTICGGAKGRYVGSAGSRALALTGHPKELKIKRSCAPVLRRCAGCGSIGPSRQAHPRRTLLVRSMLGFSALFWFLLSLSGPSTVHAGQSGGRIPDVAPAEKGAGWLRLEQDQRESSERAPPTSPGEASRRRSLEQQEAMRYRETLRRQEQDLDALRRRARHGLEPTERADMDAGSRQIRAQDFLTRQRLERDAQRLRMQQERRSRLMPP